MWRKRSRGDGADEEGARGRELRGGGRGGGPRRRRAAAVLGRGRAERRGTNRGAPLPGKMRVCVCVVCGGAGWRGTRGVMGIVGGCGARVRFGGGYV